MIIISMIDLFQNTVLKFNAEGSECIHSEVKA